MHQDSGTVKSEDWESAASNTSTSKGILYFHTENTFIYMGIQEKNHHPLLGVARAQEVLVWPT